MEGISQGGRRRGPVTRSFLLTREAGWGEQGNQAGLCPLPAWLSERASKLQIGSGEYCCRGPVVIDPVFSSAWACLITFLTPLPERNIRVVGAKKGLENSQFGSVKLLWIQRRTHIVTWLFIFFFFLGGGEITFFFFHFHFSHPHEKELFLFTLFVVFVFRIPSSHLTEHNV